jgi:hypothetical protein
MLQPIYTFYYLAPACFDAIAIFRELTLKLLKHTAINSSAKHTHAMQVLVKYN